MNELRSIFDKTHGHCHFCGDPLKFDNRGWSSTMDGHWEVDHVIQRHKGGAITTKNCFDFADFFPCQIHPSDAVSIVHWVSVACIAAKNGDESDWQGNLVDAVWHGHLSSNRWDP